MEDDIKGRTPLLKSILILNGSQPQWKSDRKQMALVCLASQFLTELGPAQPQLVSSSVVAVLCMLFSSDNFLFEIWQTSVFRKHNYCSWKLTRMEELPEDLQHFQCNFSFKHPV